MPVVIYMHGNAGCKLEAEELAPYLLPQGINLFAFDFSGCGHSDGEWVTLGWKERKDLVAVINHLNSLGSVSKIGLWGRSMGAAASIMYTADNQDKVHASVLDSGFASFIDIANHLAANQFGIPPEFVQFLMMGVSQQIAQLTGGMNIITDLNVAKFAPRCKVPALFVHGSDDDFVEMSHSEKNFEAYGGEVKDVMYCSGGHNDARPKETIEQMVNFMKKHLTA